MQYSYNKLWKKLIDKNMKKKDLKIATNIASSTMAKMSKEKPIKLEVLARICKTLQCEIGDIIEIKY